MEKNEISLPYEKLFSGKFNKPPTITTHTGNDSKMQAIEHTYKINVKSDIIYNTHLFTKQVK